MNLRCVFTLIVIISLVGVSAAADKYVSPSAGIGGDGSVGSPWNITYAFSTATAGTTVHILAGEYGAKNLVVANSGTSGSPIQFVAYGGTAKIYNTTTVGNGIYILNKNYVTVSGFNITRYQSGVRVSGTTTGVIVSNCTIAKSTYGLYLSSPNVLSSNNTVHSCVRNINIDGGKYTTVRGCNVYNATNNAIYLRSGNNSIISNSYIHDNPVSSIWFSSLPSPNCIVRNCNISNNKIAITPSIAGCNNLTIANNTISGHTKENVSSVYIVSGNTHMKIINNTFDNNFMHGQFFSDHDIIYDNTFENNIHGGLYIGGNSGLVYNNNFDNLDFFSSGGAMSGYNYTISDNEIAKIELKSGQNNTIINNHIFGYLSTNTEGYYDTSYNNISYNNFTGNGSIILYPYLNTKKIVGNIISNNTFTSTHDVPIKIKNGTSNIISNNRILSSPSTNAIILTTCNDTGLYNNTIGNYTYSIALPHVKNTAYITLNAYSSKKWMASLNYTPFSNVDENISIVANTPTLYPPHSFSSNDADAVSSLQNKTFEIGMGTVTIGVPRYYTVSCKNVPSVGLWTLTLYRWDGDMFVPTGSEPGHVNGIYIGDEIEVTVS